MSLLIAGLVVAFGGDDDNTVNASSSSTTSTSLSDEVIASSTTTRRPSATTTSTIVTTNTTAPIETADLDCARTTPATPTPQDNWEEYWLTEPADNQPMNLQVCVDDTTPKVGQVVTIAVIAADRDAQVGTGACDIRVTWAPPTKKCRTTTVVENGPQPTPGPANGKSVTLTFTHTYNEAGDQSVDVAVWSGADDQKRHPYKSYASISRQITVHK